MKTVWCIEWVGVVRVQRHVMFKLLSFVEVATYKVLDCSRYNRLITIVNSIHRNCESFDHSKCVSISNRLRQTLWWAHNSNVNSNLIGPAHAYQFLLLRFRRLLTTRLAFKVLPMLVSLAPCDIQYWHTKKAFFGWICSDVSDVWALPHRSTLFLL